MLNAESFDFFCKHLVERLKLRLPGFEAQHRMEPPTRRHLLGNPRRTKPRLGAVLIAIFPDSSGLSTIMIRRAVYDGVHSGQIAFPGGRHESTDASLVHTAVREACEEVGLLPEAIHLAGTLSSLYVPPSNFDVLPVVAFLHRKPSLVPQKEEVTDAFYVSLQDLIEEQNCKMTPVMLNNHQVVDVPAYVIDDKVIWGATAMMISELLHIIRELPPY